jgi:hypothetical protein
MAAIVTINRKLVKKKKMDDALTLRLENKRAIHR